MSWTIPVPQDRWKEREVFSFLREVWRRMKFASFTLDLPSIAGNTTVDVTLTTTDDDAGTGLRAGMPIHVTPPSTLDAGLVVSAAWVATDDTLTVRVDNITGGAINAASGTWSYMGALP